MTIKLLIGSTHSKIVYKESTKEEKIISEDILTDKFTFRDTSLDRHPLVKKRLMRPYTSFYVEDKNLLPTGFIPRLRVYYKREAIKFEVRDLRQFPIYDKEFVAANTHQLGEFQAYEWQTEALKKIVRCRGGICASATGTGKTYLMALLLKTYYKSKCLLLFDDILLIRQTRNDLINEFEFKEKDIGIIQGPNFEDDKRITLLSVKSYEKAFHIFPDIRIVICDECDSTGRSPTAEKVIFCCQNASIKIGLSATPDELDNPTEQARLYGNLGPIVYRNTIEEGVKANILSKVKIKIFNSNVSNSFRSSGSWSDIYEWIRVEDNEHEKELIKEGYTITERPNYKSLYGRKFQGYGDESNMIVFNEERNETIAELAKDLKRCLVFFRRHQHGKILKELLPHGMLIGGWDDVDEREKAKKYLNENKDAIVLSSNIWKRGQNIPQVRHLINASGGRSRIEVIQKLGRATRKAKGKVEAVIYDLYDDFSKICLRQSKQRIAAYRKLNLPIKVYKNVA